MVLGEYSFSIDKKGRMFIPSKHREPLGEKIIVCRGLDKNPCLHIYSLSEWQLLDEKIRSLPSAKSRMLQMYLYSGAAELEYDSQGRVLIPANLREHANLEGNVKIVGVSTHAEVWNPETWDKATAECTPEAVFDIMQELNF